MPAHGRTPSICFVALGAYDVLSGRANGHHSGGAEVQQMRVAQWLVRHGYNVSFVTLDHGQPDGAVVQGIRVFRAYASENGIRGLRFVHPCWSGLWRAMARADADVYYQRCAESETGQVALWCRLHRRRFVFATASNSDCDASLFALTSWRERVLYRLGLRWADAVAVQTQTQRDLLRRNMGVEAAVIRNCGSDAMGPALCKPPLGRLRDPLRVLWVGSIREVKRLDWLLGVAERCQDIAFNVVGAPARDSAYASSLRARAAGIRNVTMHGRVPYAEMPTYYQRCDVLCCTSAYEGFPNTFLEAWNLGIPVLSTFDPDGVIAANGLGWVAGSTEQIVAYLQKIRQTPGMWTEASDAARRYYLANHTPDACLPALERLLLRVAGCEARPV